MPQNFQRAQLQIIFDVKQDLQRKSHLIIWGHLIGALDNTTYSSTVKTISICTLLVITNKTNIKCLCDDVINAFVNSYTTKKLNGIKPQFGPERVGMVVIIKKAFYVLKLSSACFHRQFFWESVGTFLFHTLLPQSWHLVGGEWKESKTTSMFVPTWMISWLSHMDLRNWWKNCKKYI